MLSVIIGARTGHGLTHWTDAVFKRYHAELAMAWATSSMFGCRCSSGIAMGFCRRAPTNWRPKWSRWWPHGSQLRNINCSPRSRASGAWSTALIIRRSDALQIGEDRVRRPARPGALQLAEVCACCVLLCRSAATAGKIFSNWASPVPRSLFGRPAGRPASGHAIAELPRFSA